MNLGEFEKTPFRGLYISKKNYEDFGRKYIGRFQLNKKRYMKVLGFSLRDELNDEKAYKLLVEYKNELQNPVVKTIEKKKDKKLNCTCLEKVESEFKYLFDEFNIDKLDMDEVKDSIKKHIEATILKPYQIELIKLQQHLEKYNQKMIILFEGRDASGKGGAIRRITRYMNSKHYRVVALGKPTDEEKTQWYYQRYVKHFPKGGEIVLFDRSWYNRAMVEPVFGFCTDEQYEIFINGVVDFEKDLVNQGIILKKLYFSVSKAEQAKRFESRMNEPLKQWKLSEVDLQAQDLWDEFSQKKYEMLKRTHSEKTPWYVIRSDDKFRARLEAIKVILNSFEYEGRNNALNYSYDDNYSISVQKELALMRKDRNY